MSGMITAEERNQLNRDFWADTTRRRDALLAEKGVFPQIFELLESEITGGMPYAARSSFESACERFEDLRRGARRSDGLKGGRPPGGGRFQRWIEELVRLRPSLSFEALLAAVHAAAGGDVISDVEGEEITYLGDDGRPRTIRSANLRARFYRAKKKVNSPK